MANDRNQQGLRYAEIVDYEQMDPFKIRAQEAAATTAENLNQFGFSEFSASRGESVFGWEEPDRIKVGVMEGLGTKNLVADEVDEAAKDGTSHYDQIAQDSIAMIVNDLAVCGGKPQLFWMHLATGSSGWFADEVRIEAFTRGTAEACDAVGMTWAGGETPTLPGMVMPEAAEISGFVLGEVSPKDRYIAGNNIQEGDAVILVESNGIHANGLSAARKLSERLPDGYQTELSDGTSFGETLLRPTHLYSGLVSALLDADIKPSRIENITGHGWRKLMRAREEFTYRMHDVPEPMPIFDFLQEHLGVDDEEMFGNYNMGAGYALYVRPEDIDRTLAVSAEVGFEDTFHAGNVEKGPKQVIIEPIDLIFPGSTLAVRG
jgi:phosphoribosylformylglycinamidine cyclo-ligase